MPNLYYHFASHIPNLRPCIGNLKDGEGGAIELVAGSSTETAAYCRRRREGADGPSVQLKAGDATSPKSTGGNVMLFAGHGTDDDIWDGDNAVFVHALKISNDKNQYLRDVHIRNDVYEDGCDELDCDEYGMLIMTVKEGCWENVHPNLM